MTYSKEYILKSLKEDYQDFINDGEIEVANDLLHDIKIMEEDSNSPLYNEWNEHYEIAHGE